MEKGERNFENTKQFVRDVYEDAYIGEIPLDRSQIDFNKPYTQIGNNYYQVEFGLKVMKKGDEIQLFSLSTENKPRPLASTSKRRTNAALLYIFSDPNEEYEPYQTLQQIGNMYGVTGEQIRMDIKRCLNDLHSVAKEETRVKYPLNRLMTRRPFTLSSRINNSLSKGEFSAIEIKRMVEEGMSTKEIVSEYGSKRLNNARRTLNGWGMEVPPRMLKDFKGIVEKVKDPATTKEELQMLIKEFDGSAISKYNAKRGGVIVNISDVQFAAWGNKDTRKTAAAYNLLQSSGIPVHTFSQVVSSSGKPTKLNYYITFNITEDEAVEILKKSSSGNAHTPVTQIAGGALEAIPNTNMLFGTRKGEWERVSLSKFGFRTVNEFMSVIADSDIDIPVVLSRASTATRSSKFGIHIRTSDREAFNAWMRKMKK